MNSNLNSVTARIGEAVKAFIEYKSNDVEPRFYAADLRAYVLGFTHMEVAPGSSDRILRDLRQRGLVNYQLLIRSKSYYLALPLSTGAAA